jgi:hypothetical protein
MRKPMQKPIRGKRYKHGDETGLSRRPINQPTPRKAASSAGLIVVTTKLSDLIDTEQNTIEIKMRTNNLESIYALAHTC